MASWLPLGERALTSLYKNHASSFPSSNAASLTLLTTTLHLLYPLKSITPAYIAHDRLKLTALNPGLFAKPHLMNQRSERPTPSSPADRFQSPLQRRDTTPIPVEHEERTERRTAHLWGHFDSFGRDPSPDRRQEREDRSFEDFRPADPIKRLDSSAPIAQSARNSGVVAATRDADIIAADDSRRASPRKSDRRTPHESIGSLPKPGDVLDFADDEIPNFDQQPIYGSRWQDWVAPAPSQTEHTHSWRQDSSVTGSFSYTSPGGLSLRKSAGEASKESVESYHAALQTLNAAKSNDSSGERRSVKRWLKGQQRNPDLKLGDFESLRLSGSSTWPASPEAMPHTPNHVSTFQPADEYKHLDSRSLTSQQKSHRVDRDGRRVSIIPEVTPPPSTRQEPSPRKEHKRSFFGSLGSAFRSSRKVRTKRQSKQQDKQREKQHEEQQDNWERRPSTLSQHRREEDPFGKASALTYNPTKSSGRLGRTGYFSRQPRSSEGDVDAPVKGPYVGFSKRTKTLDSPPLGGGRPSDLEIPQSEPNRWLKPHRTRINRSSSSAYSPCDTSARAMQTPAAFSAWKTHLDSRDDAAHLGSRVSDRPSSNGPMKSQEAPLDFDRPAQASSLMQTSSPVSRPTFGHLPVEAKRIPTPPTSNELASKEKAKYFWDSFYPPGTDRDSTRDSEKNSNISDRWHTPFPIPNDASIIKAKNPEIDDKDWFRVKVMGGDDEAKDIEDLRMFEWDLPEHLPNSPLCPLNPKHPGKGTGVCVYHGKKKRRDLTLTSGKYGEVSPAELGIDKWI